VDDVTVEAVDHLDDEVVAERDAAAEETGLDLHRALAARRITVPGHHLDRDDLSVELAGQGESYAAWLVRAGEQTVLFRFPRRPPEEMPAAMADEFAALQRVPEDLGTRGLAVDDTPDNALGRRYLVTTYVPGRVVDGTAWTQPMLDTHTDQLARLHDPSVVDDGDPLPPRDLAAELSRDFAGWCAGSPEVASASSAGSLAPAVVELLRRRRWAFDDAGPRVLVHGDAVATNVVFDERGTARCIDWEWAHTGDVAQDLAYIGGRVHGGPWYVPMSQTQVEAQVGRYLRARRAGSVPPEDQERLLARREAWEVYERFMSSLHFERVHRTSPDGERYGPWIATLRTTLRQLLG
jgi:aminoglycoside phosphotransferase (APT) family kinase protein